MEVMTEREVTEFTKTLSDKELMLVKTIYSMCENLVRLEDEEGDFDYSYATQYTCISGLAMGIIQQCRNQIACQKQIQDLEKVIQEAGYV